jgi:hypothetical protein
MPGTGSSGGASGWSLVSVLPRSSICPAALTCRTAPAPPAAARPPANSSGRLRILLRRACPNRILGTSSQLMPWFAARPPLRDGAVPGRRI